MIPQLPWKAEHDEDSSAVSSADGLTVADGLDADLAEFIVAGANELTHLLAVAGALRRFLGAGISEAKEAWIPEWLSNEYEALVDAWLALPSELRDALAALRERRGEGE